MRTQILTLSALVAAGVLAATGPAVAAAEKASAPKLTLGGYAEAGMAFRDNSNAVGGNNTGGLAQFNDSEVYFSISGGLDNGIKFVGRFELEGSVADEDNHMDAMWMGLRGSFGEVQMGQTDNSAMMMVTGYQGSWATSAAHSMAFERGEIVPAGSGFSNIGPAFGVREDLGDNKSNKITYMSPRVGGIQIGASYARDTGATGADATISQTSTGGENLITIAVNFTQKFDNVSVGVAGGYLQDEAGTVDRRAVVGGLSVESGPFKVAFGFNSVDDDTVGTSQEGAGWDIGARYTAGPNKFSIGYFQGEVEGASATAGNDETESLWLGYGYAAGPGVAWRTSIGWASYDGEAGDTDESGYGIMTSVRLSF